MAFRVTVVRAPDLTIIRVDGRLPGPGARDLERECLVARRPIVLDLTHLTGLDEAACQVMHQLTGEGCHMVGVSPYIAMVLGEPGAAGARPPAGDTSRGPSPRCTRPGTHRHP